MSDNYRHHRILLCGVGSVGERHLQNLRTLGCENIALHRTRNRAMRTLESEYPIFTDLKSAIAKIRPDVVLVCNPTSMHLASAMSAAQAGANVFIEKPLSHSLKGINALNATLHANGRVGMVGYMLRFHPLLLRIKQWIDEGENGTLGRPIFARASWGEHVPDWHPWEDYRETYTVRKELGGGPALTLSHELDTLVWMFGKADQVVAMTSANTALETSCEHVVDMLIRFKSGVTANVHLDYCQRPPQRSWELVCSRGRVELDVLGGILKRWNGEIGELPAPEKSAPVDVEVVHTPKAFARNDMFVDEMRYFLDCIASGRVPSPSVVDAAESVRIACLAVESNS